VEPSVIPSIPESSLPRHLKMRELRVLLAVAEQGSFRKAAQALHITQPAVTSAIADLERTLGVPLFERTPHGTTLTAFGASLSKHASAIFDELRLASEELTVISTGWSGSLRVGTVPMPATSILPVALVRLLKDHPDVFVSVMEASETVLAEAVKARKIDLFVSRLPSHAMDDELQYRVLYEDTVCVIASRTHRLSGRKRLGYAELSGERWIMPPEGTFFFEHVQRVLGAGGFTMPRHSIKTMSIPVMYGMVAEGQFLAFAASSQYRFTPMKPLLTALPLDLPPVTAPIGIVTPKRREINRVAANLVGHIQSLVKEDVVSIGRRRGISAEAPLS
jgi:DNA-binding transcriptional LysR family regulator